MAKNKKLNLGVLKQSMKDAGQKVVKGSKAPTLAKTLAEFYLEQHGEDGVAKCPNCGCAGPEDAETCPFCGAQLGEAVEEDDSPVKAPSPAKKKGKAKKEEFIVDEKLAVQCQEEVGHIVDLKQSVNKNIYEIGTKLKNIQDNNLWKHMGYKSWTQFCSGELEYTGMMAGMYIAITSLPQETVLALGSKKSNLIVKAPEKQQKKLTKLALEGKSFSELKNILEGKPKVDDNIDKITLLSRIAGGDLFLEWQEDEEGEFCHVEYLTGTYLTIWPTDEDNGLILRLSKDDAPYRPEEEEEDEENSEETPAEDEDYSDELKE